MIKDEWNGETLAQCNIRNDEVLTVTNKGQHAVSKFPLLNEEQTDLNDRLKFVFNQMFDTYAKVDEDQPDRKVMTAEETRHFIMDATKEESKLSDPRIKTIMAWDSDGDGKMTREDFLSFYKNSTFTKPETVRKNLTHYNYRGDMKQAPRPGDDDNILQARKTINEMPRYKISFNENNFYTLIRLLDYQSEVQKLTQSVVKMICTST